MNNRLNYWQEALYKSRLAYDAQLADIEGREALYAGTRDISGTGRASTVKQASHVRNIAAELVECQVSASIPQPKVTARRPEDEGKAKLIEDMLRNEMNRLPFEYMNDLQERTCPIQGGSLLLVEWDNAKRSARGVGELMVTDVHPSRFIPQEGVFTSPQDMDYCFILLPQTKQSLFTRYGVHIDKQETDTYDTLQQEELITQVMVFYRNEEGGVGLYSFAGDTELTHMTDYQARQYEGRAAETETLASDVFTTDGRRIPAGTVLPYYNPNVIPVILRKNVSVFGKLLGDSDIDKIADQQNTIKKLSTKMNEKLLKGGSYVTFPAGVYVQKDDSELKVINVSSPADVAMIHAINLQPDISGDMAYMRAVYEEARQSIGITDSFLGRNDNTATSGVAKQFSARQSAGRLESKRVMKEASYAQLFELMFKFKLAYTDEPRAVVSLDNQGGHKYSVFDRYDFLNCDTFGNWTWNDEFLFSCDAAAGLAANRESMWQETRLNFREGAFGNPSDPDTLILFWSRMEQLHYPTAADNKTYLEERAKALKQTDALPMPPMEGGEQIWQP